MYVYIYITHWCGNQDSSGKRWGIMTFGMSTTFKTFQQCLHLQAGRDKRDEGKGEFITPTFHPSLPPQASLRALGCTRHKTRGHKEKSEME